MISLPNWTTGIHHDGSERFISNPLPRLGETITFDLRIPLSAPVTSIRLRAMINGEFSYRLMEDIAENKVSQIWRCDLHIKQKRVDYIFILDTEMGDLYYTARGLSFADSPDSDAFTIIADYTAPIWVRDQVYYQIFPERFANGDESNDVQDGEITQGKFKSVKREWGEQPLPWVEAGNLDFYGGDLQGIAQNLDYLSELGITGIYLTPIFESESNHKYDITSFYHVDPHFGGDDALALLRDVSRKYHMTLMLDITPNHCSYNHPWVTLFKENMEGDSSDFFYYDKERDFFETWWGVSTLIKLNYNSPRLRDLMYRAKHSAMRKWLLPPYSIDAWRLDVANMTGNQDKDQLDHAVWRELRESVRETNPNTYILGEYFQDASTHLQGDELDASMNYQGFNVPMRRWLKVDEKQVRKTDQPKQFKASIPAEVMAEQWQRFLSAVPYPIALQQFNQLDSHDTTRILHETAGDKELVKLGTALMLAFPGVPCIYYGTEIGLTGGKDPDNRRCMIWDESEWDKDLLAYFQKIIAIRKESHAMKHGSFKVLHAEGDLVAFTRESTEQTLITVGYRGDSQSKNVVIDLAQLAVEDGTSFTDLISGYMVTVNNGQITIDSIKHGQALYLANK